MKKFYILLVALLLATSAMAQWVPQNSGTTNHLYSVCFTEAITGYAVGDSGTILKTTDGGINWIAQNSGTLIVLSSVYFTNANTGVIVGDNGTILKTTDGGVNWIPKPSGTPNCLRSVHFPEENIGYIVGCGVIDSTLILKTTDSGETWTKYFWAGHSADLRSVYFLSADTGYACGFWGGWPGNHPIVLKTINGGIDWTPTPVPLNGSLYAVFFTDANTGYTAGLGENNPQVYKTTDGGMSWSSTSFYNSVSYISSVYFPNSVIGYAVGYEASPDNGVILKTTDAGTNWMLQTSGTSNYLFSAYFIDENTGYVVGDNGTILKTTNGGVVGLNESSITSKFLNLYPNPAKDKITIETSLLFDAYLSILNVNSQEIMKRQVIDHKTQIDVSNLPSGVYFVKLQNRNTVEIKKLIKE